MNQARNMHTASNRFIKMAPPGWLKYYRDKSHLGRASQPGSCNQGLTVSCNATQFARDSFVICRFREREIDCLTFAFTKMFRKIRLESKWNTTFWVVSAENFWEQRNTRKRQYRFSERNIPIGNSCSISSKSSLILVSGLRGRVSVNGTDFYKW